MRQMKPTEAVAAAVAELCRRNDYTAGAEAAAVLLGQGAAVVLLRRPIVIEGQAEDVASAPAAAPSAERWEINLCDLIDHHRQRHGRPAVL